jgi:hypothetical protein
MKWFWRRKKRTADDEPRGRERLRPDQVKDLRARLTSDGHTLKH